MAIFYLAMYQGSLPPNAAPIGIDQTAPTVYRSYSYIADADQWTLSPYQDFMIHAMVYGPQSGADMVLSAEKSSAPQTTIQTLYFNGKAMRIARLCEIGGSLNLLWAMRTTQTVQQLAIN